jgi:hypothetical protein
VPRTRKGGALLSEDEHHHEEMTMIELHDEWEPIVKQKKELAMRQEANDLQHTTITQSPLWMKQD